MIATLTDSFDALVDLLLGSQCVHCQVAGGPICDPCRRLLHRVSVRPIEREQPPFWVSAGTTYESIAQSVVIAAKRTGDRRLVSVLGEMLGHAVQQQCRRYPHAHVVALPSGGRTRWRVGGNFPELLIRRSSDIGLERFRTGVFVRQRGSVQKGLVASQRAANARRSWRLTAAAAELAGQQVILVDDVMTTGATLSAAHLLLSDIGCQVVGGAVVATVVPVRQHTA